MSTHPRRAYLAPRATHYGRRPFACSNVRFLRLLALVRRQAERGVTVLRHRRFCPGHPRAWGGHDAHTSI